MTPSELFLARRLYRWITAISVFCGLAMGQALSLILIREHVVWGGVCAALSGSLFLVNVKAIQLHWRDYGEQIRNRRNQGER